MTQSFMGNKECWMEHMALNATDGMDPEGIALRASEGLLGVDYFFPGYAVWAGLIEAAADLGYDTNNLVSEPGQCSHAHSLPISLYARRASARTLYALDVWPEHSRLPRKQHRDSKVVAWS